MSFVTAFKTITKQDDDIIKSANKNILNLGAITEKLHYILEAPQSNFNSHIHAQIFANSRIHARKNPFSRSRGIFTL